MSAQSNVSRGGPQGGMAPAVMSSGPQSWDMATRADTAQQMPGSFNPATGTMPIGNLGPNSQFMGVLNQASEMPAQQSPMPPTMQTGAMSMPQQQAGTCPTCGK